MTVVGAGGRSARGAQDPLSREALFRQVGSLVGAVQLGFLAMAGREAPDAAAGLVLRASLIIAATVVATIVLPWHRLPSFVHRVLPFLYLGGVYLTIDATGGAESAYVQLVFLPVLWVAVYGTPLEVVIAFAVAGGVLAVPYATGPVASEQVFRVGSMLLPGGMLALLVHRFFARIRHETGRLHFLAGTDPLTGVANRRAWDEELQHAIIRAGRDLHPLTVAVIDLDQFKEYNDRLGHQAGDRLLKEVASAWQGILRASDTLARIGGDEFAILLPGCSIETAATIADRLCNAVEGATCSVGVAAWDGRETSEKLLARADASLYKAKAGGRARVVVTDQTDAIVDVTGTG